MMPVRDRARAFAGTGAGLACCAILMLSGALPAWSQINPPQAEPMQQEPATGTLPLSAAPSAQSRDSGPVVTASPEGAELRMLDKMSGEVTDVVLSPGGSAPFGALLITLQECRYPIDDPDGNAYAYLIIRDATAPAPLFRGWMIANSPALNALDHPRYDVWLRHCAMTDNGEATGR